MNDLTVTARFRRTIQPVPHESAEAEITVGGVIDPAQSPAKFLDEAQRAVLAAVGKSHEFRSASPGNVIQGGEPAAKAPQGGPDTPKAEEPAADRPRRGRPPKADKAAEVPTQDALEAALADAAGKLEPDAAKLAGAEDPAPRVEEAKDLPPVTDEELQNACAAAAEKITAAKVKNLYGQNYRVSRVAEIESDYRRPFLKDLKALVDKETAAKKGE